MIPRGFHARNGNVQGKDDLARLFKPEVRKLPRLNTLISKGLGDDGLVWLKLPPPAANTGKALSWCRSVIQKMLNKGPHVYKIGITADPLFRFYKRPTFESPSPGYYHCNEKFKGMYVIYAAATFEEAALMEAVLIESHQGLPGNRNERAGGDGRKSDQGPPFFTYIAFKSAM